jgi:hypothetical protein
VNVAVEAGSASGDAGSKRMSFQVKDKHTCTEKIGGTVLDEKEIMLLQAETIALDSISVSAITIARDILKEGKARLAAGQE